MKQIEQKEVIDYMNDLAYKIKRGEVNDVIISYTDSKCGVATRIFANPITMMLR